MGEDRRAISNEDGLLPAPLPPGRKERETTPQRSSVPSLTSTAEQPNPPGVFDAEFDALLFIKGDNNLPNSLRTVEQADRWRQTYVVTDEGPSYRPGDNFYVLRPPRSDGAVTPLTRFQGGYVGEPEISWDGRQVIFTRREPDSLWWHLWRINTDGSRWSSSRAVRITAWVGKRPTGALCCLQPHRPSRRNITVMPARRST